MLVAKEYIPPDTSCINFKSVKIQIILFDNTYTCSEIYKSQRNNKDKIQNKTPYWEGEKCIKERNIEGFFCSVSFLSRVLKYRDAHFIIFYILYL